MAKKLRFAVDFAIVTALPLLCNVGMMLCEPDDARYKLGIVGTVAAGAAVAKAAPRVERALVARGVGRCAAGGAGSAVVLAAMVAFPAGLIAYDLWRSRRWRKEHGES